MEPQVHLGTLGQGALGGPSMLRLIDADFDLGVCRPFKHNGKNYVTLNAGRPNERTMVTNAPALLRREDWLRIDQAIMWQAKQRLRLWDDIYSRNPFVVPDGLGTIAIQHAVADGDASAIVSMDGIRRSERSRPTLDVRQIPLPIIHSDGSFTAREIAVAKKSGMPLDTTGITLAGRKVAETIEQLALGTFPTYTYAGGTIYGITNFPDRSLKSMTLPTAWSTTGPKVFINEILDMIQTLELLFFFGPYTLYVSNAWTPYLDNDYTTVYSADTLRTRLRKIDKITDVRTLDYLTGYQAILVQMTPDVVEGISGMDFTTVQWESGDGMELSFKVMGIKVPRVRSNFNSHTGIIHGTAA